VVAWTTTGPGKGMSKMIPATTNRNPKEPFKNIRRFHYETQQRNKQLITSLMKPPRMGEKWQLNPKTSILDGFINLFFNRNEAILNIF